MKFWILALLLCGIVFYLFFPPVNKERLCYEAGKTSLDEITSDALVTNLPLSVRCDRSADALYTLESCIRDATKSSAVAHRANDTILRIVATIRMSENNLWMLKAAHNEECTGFSSSQLP